MKPHLWKDFALCFRIIWLRVSFNRLHALWLALVTIIPHCPHTYTFPAQSCLSLASHPINDVDWTINEHCIWLPSAIKLASHSWPLHFTDVQVCICWKDIDIPIHANCLTLSTLQTKYFSKVDKTNSNNSFTILWLHVNATKCHWVFMNGIKEHFSTNQQYCTLCAILSTKM